MKSFGDYLVEDGVLTPTQVETVLARQRDLNARGESKRFGEIVLDMRLATEAQVQAALDRQRRERA